MIRVVADRADLFGGEDIDGGRGLGVGALGLEPGADDDHDLVGFRLLPRTPLARTRADQGRRRWQEKARTLDGNTGSCGSPQDSMDSSSPWAMPLHDRSNQPRHPHAPSAEFYPVWRWNGGIEDRLTRQETATG